MTAKLCHIIAFCFLISIISCPAYSQEKLLASSDDGMLEYYLMDRPIKSGHSLKGKCEYIECWLKLKPGPNKIAEFRSDEIEQRKNDNEKTQGYLKYDYKILKFQFDCGNQKVRVMSFTDYDTNGNVLDNVSGGDLESDWIDAVPESINEVMLTSVCEYVSTNNSK